MHSQKAGYPIIWGAMAFVLIALGLRKKKVEMRIAAMVLLGLTLFKIFAIDVWDMSQLGRIISFVTLGILILVMSFMYHRLKRLLFMQEQEEQTETMSEETNPS